MKNFCALLMLVTLAAASRGAVAQELFPPSAEYGLGDTPPSLGFDGEEVSPLEPEPLLDDFHGPAEDCFEGSILGEPMQYLAPAYFESSGTWLKRGYWYTEVDYVLLNRSWDRKGLQVAFESTTGTVPTPGALQGPFGVVVGTNELRIRGQRPGADGLARVKLGRFLFRDSFNRDHMTELAFYGGGDWMQSTSLEASTPNGLEIPAYIDRVNPSFDGARRLAFDYQSEMNSGEWNYLVRQRMSRDQMVLQPSGEWVRRAAPTRTTSYLAGLRYLNHRERLDFNAFEIPVSAALDEGGNYNILTENNMLGFQGGGTMSLEASRWSIGVTGKMGAFWNRIDLNSRFQVGETTIVNSGVTNSDEDDLSFIGEFQLTGKWHLRPNLSLRAGFEMLFVDSIALAPFQLNFIPGGFTPIAAAGDSVYMGTSLGVESYW